MQGASQFAKAVARAQAGRPAADHAHHDLADRLDQHDGRLTALEHVNTTTFDASEGKLKPAGMKPPKKGL